jgi:vacuolar-type H+-ATPase subunit E/Vma4
MSQQLITDDILAHGKADLDSIRQQSNSTLAQRRESLDSKLALIVDEADKRIDEEEQRIRLRWARHLAQEERRVHLSLQDRVVQAVIDRVRNELNTLRENPDYPLLLSEWIIEAAIGLGYGSDGGGIPQDRTEIRIRCIPDDRELLNMEIPGIEGRFLALTGRSIKLVFDEMNLSPESIGVILIDETGRTAFSNTLADRFRRASQDVHRLVMERMFPGSNE